MENFQKAPEFKKHLAYLVYACLGHHIVLKVGSQAYQVLFFHQKIYLFTGNIVDCHPDGVGANINNPVYHKQSPPKMP